LQDCAANASLLDLLGPGCWTVGSEGSLRYRIHLEFLFSWLKWGILRLCWRSWSSSSSTGCFTYSVAWRAQQQQRLGLPTGCLHCPDLWCAFVMFVMPCQLAGVPFCIFSSKIVVSFEFQQLCGTIRNTKVLGCQH
jgi:hypothetical protein